MSSTFSINIKIIYDYFKPYQTLALSDHRYIKDKSCYIFDITSLHLTLNVYRNKHVQMSVPLFSILLAGILMS